MNNMARKLPPLHLLQLFESAGRHSSFKKAAEELFLTPSAISHQIKSLEENLGIALFKRLSRGVILTSAGEKYFATVQDIFHLLDNGTASLKQEFSPQSQSTLLRISTFSTIASNIIIPNLGLFQREFPSIEISIETSMDLIDLRYDNFDLALRLGDGNYLGVISEKIFNLQVTPLCSPEFAKKHDLTNIDQVLSVPLIQNVNMKDSWSRWGDTVGLNNLKPGSTLQIGSYDGVMQAAQQGLGLALGAFPLENLALKSGVLVQPFKEKSQFSPACFAVYHPRDKEREDIHLFITWFKQLIETSMGE
jgi:LysR family glycine cleavage system transcriptional activator